MATLAGEDGRSLSESLFARLSEAIVQGEFPAGSKLSEPRLAARYGVSRGPLREAIRQLEERKLVTRSPRQGVRVIVPSRTFAIELFRIREVLEGLAAREAAQRAKPADIAALRAVLKMQRRTLADPDDSLRWQAAANTDYHVLIARIAQNETLFGLLCNEFYTLFRLYRRQHRVVPGRARQALAEHERVVDAIAEGDGELAELLMRRHIASARMALERSLQGAPVA